MKRKNKKTKYKRKTRLKNKFKKYKKTLRNKNKKIKKSMKGGMEAMDEEKPLPIFMSNAKLYIIKPGDEPIPIDPRPIDKINHVRPLIEKFREMIDSGDKYNLYISIGSNCLHYIDEEEKLNKCIEGQIKIPEGWVEPDCITKVFIIDYDSIRMKEELESRRHNIDDYEFFNIFWLDDVEELNMIFNEYVEYNISKNGKILCINYAKYNEVRQPCQFQNLINILYGVDKPPYIYNTKHQDIINSRRAFYLDHIYRTGTGGGKTLVELFYHYLVKQMPIEKRTEIFNIEDLIKEKTPNKVYFSTDKIIF